VTQRGQQRPGGADPAAAGHRACPAAGGGPRRMARAGLPRGIHPDPKKPRVGSASPLSDSTRIFHANPALQRDKGAKRGRNRSLPCRPRTKRFPANPRFSFERPSWSCPATGGIGALGEGSGTFRFNRVSIFALWTRLVVMGPGFVPPAAASHIVSVGRIGIQGAYPGQRGPNSSLPRAVLSGQASRTTWDG
jgi:hypothetical protein